MWLRLRQIALVAHKLRPVVDDLKAVFGLEVGCVDPGVAKFGLENALLPVGSQFLEIVAPTEEGTAGGRYLDRRGGDGGYMVINQCGNHAPRKSRIIELGIRTVYGYDRPGHSVMQLHPKDTGGSFLEIDWVGGGGDPGGPWPPAGDDWQGAVRTNVITAISAAEIQGPKPEVLAARWSEIVQIDVTRDEDGRPTLVLQNATIRFVEDADGRGEGLGGIDVVAADPERALAAARERDRLSVEGAIMIGGLRFYLVS